MRLTDKPSSTSSPGADAGTVIAGEADRDLTAGVVHRRPARHIAEPHRSDELDSGNASEKQENAGQA
jgi:hypothetical protein